MRGVGIIGRPRVGKDSAADHLIQRHGFTRVSIADPIKRAALGADPIIGWSKNAGEPVRLAKTVERYGWEYAKDTFPEVRRFLWKMSVDGVATVLGEDVWTDAAVRAIRAVSGPVVVTDVRLIEEVKALRAEGLRMVYMTREGVPELDSREGEHLGPDAADFRLHNGGGLDELGVQVDALVTRIRDES
ncbi:hypothetical protein ACIQU6_07440 [Streptomyces sp. NPDC090442]|uniref:hypothetical protein n=1 Tax=Streptomyces sp. NPDC090442 TaxID=3365962 RepID=UPI0037F7E888